MTSPASTPITDDAFTNDEVPTPSAEVEVIEPEVVETPAEPAWPYETMKFRGDIIEFRKPTMQALSAFSFGTSKHVSDAKQNDAVGMFIVRHLSDKSWDTIMERMIDPDDTAWDKTTLSKLMGRIVKIAVGKDPGPEDDEDSDD